MDCPGGASGVNVSDCNQWLWSDHAFFLYIVNRSLTQTGGLNQLAPPGTVHAFTIVHIGGIGGTVGTAGLLQACSARALELFSANLLAPVHWPDTAIGDVLGFHIDLDCHIQVVKQRILQLRVTVQWPSFLFL